MSIDPSTRNAESTTSAGSQRPWCRWNAVSENPESSAVAPRAARAGASVPERGEVQRGARRTTGPSGSSCAWRDEAADDGAGDAADRVGRVEPLQHGAVRDRLDALALDVEEHVDETVADTRDREGDPERRRGQQGHTERTGAEREQCGGAQRAQREPREPRRDERHREDRDERQEREQQPHRPEGEVVERLHVHDEDDPDAPVLAERPVAGQQDGDATSLDVDIQRGSIGGRLHGGDMMPVYRRRSASFGRDVRCIVGDVGTDDHERRTDAELRVGPVPAASLLPATLRTIAARQRSSVVPA